MNKKHNVRKDVIIASGLEKKILLTMKQLLKETLLMADGFTLQYVIEEAIKFGV